MLLWIGINAGGSALINVVIPARPRQAGAGRNPVVETIHSRNAGMTASLQPFQHLRISQITARPTFEAFPECLFNPFGLIVPAYIAQQLYLVDII